MKSRNLIHKVAAFTACLFIFYACGTPLPFYNSGKKSKPDSLKNKPVDYSVFLVGDTGEPVLNGEDDVLSTLHYQLQQAGDSSSIVFLGDNIYQEGMNPDTTYLARQISEAKISRTMGVLDDYKGKPFFIPGNHDWRYGIGGVRAQERFVDHYAKADIEFTPDNGCPGPNGFDLGEHWYMVILDSEWWINQSFKYNVDVEGCEEKTRSDVINEVAALVDEHDDKHIMVAFHHSLYSNGNHGGYYSVKDHVFPLTNIVPDLYIPLPLIGSIYPLYRRLGQSGQDIGHERYQEFKRRILEAVEDTENIFFVAGHEHSLEFFEKEKMNESKEGTNFFIVSGAGSKHAYARTGYGAEFVYSHKGFSKLISYEDGSVDVEFWIPDNDHKEGKLVYVKQLLKPTPPEKDLNIDIRRHDAAGVQDTVITIAAGPNYKAGSTYRFFWGDHYRDAWTTEVDVPVLDFSTKKGGLKVLEKTGGQQSVTIIAQDSLGQKYVMRSVQKDPKKSLPDILQPTFVSDIAQDQTSASHPYSGLIASPLAKAAGVYHTTPELLFIPKKSGLDLDVGSDKGTLVTFEDFVSAAWFQKTYHKNVKRVISSDDLWEQSRVGNTSPIDHRQLVRSRIFDMFIGDWDRHERQWFWAETTTDSTSVFEPVPIDRDNAFFKSDGLIPWVGRRKWALRKFQLFDDDIRDIKGINFNAMFFDRWFINAVSKEEWLAIAKDMQQSLTDSVITQAVEVWPQPIAELNGKTFIKKLKARRDKLTEFASRYYDVLAKDVNVFGSDKEEFFEVERKPGGETAVTMYALIDSSGSKKIAYYRLFNADETHEVRLYGFGGEDHFNLKGNVDDGIKIRIIGGEGDDVIDDASTVDGLWKKTIVYDTGLGSTIKSAGEVKDETARDPKVNSYQKRSFEYDYLAPLLAAGYNRNDGIFLGGGALYIKEGFRKEPFEAQHRLSGKVATLTSAFSFTYQGIFTDLVGPFNIALNGDVQAPNFSSNFFGLGNETNKQNGDDDFYGYRINKVDIAGGLTNELGGGLLNIGAGIGYEFYDLSSTENRFVTSPQSGLTGSDFKTFHYATLHTGFTVSTKDDELFPRHGVEFGVLAEAKLGLNKNSESIGRITTSGSAYYTLEPITTTLATRIGLATNIGDYNFFQANTIGGQTFTGGSGSLRGFLRDRFAGKTSLYQNIEFRSKLLNLKSYLLPADVGIYGFFDEGKVWVDGESSDLWHVGYGGGVWISPLEKLVLTSGLALSTEETLFTVTLGFTF